MTPDAWTAIGTIALAAATFISTGLAVWQPRWQERRKQKVTVELDQRKCNVASMQMRNWAERQTGDHLVIHLLSDVSYPVRPVVGGMVGHHVAVSGISVTHQPDGQKLLVLDRGDDTRLDMWFVVFFDPGGNRRLLIAFLTDGGGQGVYPAPYDQDLTSLAMLKGDDLRAKWQPDAPDNQPAADPQARQ